MIKARALRRRARRDFAGKTSAQSAAPKSEPKRLTLVALASELDRLRGRLEDLEDLRDLEEAVQRNAGAPLIPWAEVKRDL